MHANGHAKCMQSQEEHKNTNVTELILWQCKDKVGSCPSRNQATVSPTMHIPHRDGIQEYMAATLHIPSETYTPVKETQLLFQHWCQMFYKYK